MQATAIQEVTPASNISYRAHPDQEAVIVTDHDEGGRTMLVSFDAISKVRILIEKNVSNPTLHEMVRTDAGQITVTQTGTAFRLFGVPKQGPERLKLIVSVEHLDGMLSAMRTMNEARSKRRTHQPRERVILVAA